MDDKIHAHRKIKNVIIQMVHSDEVIKVNFSIYLREAESRLHLFI
jgi:hypothetical protein